MTPLSTYAGESRYSESAGNDHPETWRKFVHAYCACTSFADWSAGRVLEALDRSDHADNTIVIFWSENGYHCGEKNHWEKSTLWDRPALTLFEEGAFSARDERYRYIRYPDGTEELYDHRVDPYEFKNLAAQPDVQEVKERLKKWIPDTWPPSMGGRWG